MVTKTVTAVLLAGGIGSRMKSSIPKQYMKLLGKPLALYSFELFMDSPEIDRIIVVCAPQYRELFEKIPQQKPLGFALPGKERQDSAFNALQQAENTDFLCIHDAAYPLLQASTLHAVIHAAREHGAALAATPARYTIKEATDEGTVTQTPDRKRLWSAQTPQVVRKDWLEHAYAYAQERGICCTDDTALVELMGHPIKLVSASTENIKVTTPVDLKLAEILLKTSQVSQ